MDATVTSLGDLLSTRLLLLRDLAHSLELSQSALTSNDAEMIARGAARQAELCRQWSLLEDELRRKSKAESSELSSSLQHQQEFKDLTARIRHLTRVHCSLLRHLQRSLTILACVVDRYEATYTPTLGLQRIDTRPQAGG